MDEGMWVRFTAHRPALLGAILLFVLSAMAWVGPLFSPYSYTEIHLEWKNMPPGRHFWFGSDELGRDLFTRVWWGGRISLFIGIVAALLDACIGVLWGAVAAYVGGKVEEILMRIADTLYAIPYLLVVLLLTVVRGSGMGTIVLAMTLTGWINMARIVRSQVLQIKTQEYMLAARAMGATLPRIVRCYLIPNAIGPILVTMTLTMPTAMFTEAFLSFLGLGVQAPAASWGVMVNEGLSAMRYYPWRLFFPSALITLTILSCHLVGNGLRDLCDPRLRKRRVCR